MERPQPTSFDKCQDYLLSLKDLADSYREVPQLAGPLSDALYEIVALTRKFRTAPTRTNYDELLHAMGVGLTHLAETEKALKDPMLSFALRCVIKNFSPVYILLSLDSERYVDRVN